MINEKTYHLEATVAPDGTIILTGLPLHTGDKVEVTIRKQKEVPADSDPYPLRETPFSYEKPFEPVAVEDWEALK